MSTKKKLFLAHNSCLNSSYDLNVLKAGLEQGGFEIVEKPELADEVIFSGCSVREVWVTDAVNQIDEIHRRAPSAKVTVTGCIANVSPDVVRAKARTQAINFQSPQEILTGYAGLDFKEIDRTFSQGSSHNYEGQPGSGLSNLRQRVGADKAAIVGVLQEIDRELGTNVEGLYRRTTKGFVFYNEVEASELITVTRSCLYKCSFCSIPKGRGAFESVPLKDILVKAQEALAKGIRHIILVGDEIGNYGVDTVGAKFAELMRALIEVSDELKFSIRYIEPKPFLKHANMLRELCASGKLELLYISLQSGSQRILTEMNRNYDIAKLAGIYSQFRDSATVFYCNWMVGFPGETEEDFQRTMDLVNVLNLQINVAIPFSPRPGTPAENFDRQIDEATKASRVARLTDAIADLKVRMFKKELESLHEERLTPLLEQIRQAESQQDRTQTNIRIPISIYSTPNVGGSRI
ncbi:radical SAM protein [Polaromonas sp. AER18D-145]|uniref:radical SAM protein n=1 Tax=Polaromonas sp. AER18D-145 TaxID=1977060 RepID=UPI00197C70C4|nr:radical SAM protein [Polaromonas sp. AER18D-145]